MNNYKHEYLAKLISTGVVNGGISFTIADVATKDVIYTTPSCYKLFGLNPELSYKDATNYWLNNIVHPEDLADQQKILNTAVLPKSRTYRINHPKKGLRKIRVNVSDVFEVDGKKMTISLPSDITDCEVDHGNNFE